MLSVLLSNINLTRKWRFWDSNTISPSFQATCAIVFRSSLPIKWSEQIFTFNLSIITRLYARSIAKSNNNENGEKIYYSSLTTGYLFLKYVSLMLYWWACRCDAKWAFVFGTDIFLCSIIRPIIYLHQEHKSKTLFYFSVCIILIINNRFTFCFSCFINVYFCIHLIF